MKVNSVAIVFDDTLRPETTGRYCLAALEHLVRVKHYLPRDIEKIPCGEFDLYLNVDDGLDYEWPEGLRPAAYWTLDTHIDYAARLKRTRGFDWTFAAQRDGYERLKSDGINVLAWLPLACDPAVHRRHDVPVQWDLSFIGHVFPGPRADLLRRLVAEFPASFIGQAFFDEMARIYSASRMAFNRSIANDINMRVFEVMACGTLLITNGLTDNGLEELFQEGIHLATYTDAEELVDKVRFYLAHEEARIRVAAQGLAEVVGHHTYRHRMETILQSIESKPSHGSASASGQRSLNLKNPSYFEFERPELARLVPSSAKRVLDVGCGAGTLGASLKRVGVAEVVGIELDETAAERARRRLDRVVEGDVEDASLTFPVESFDAVVCGDVLEHMIDPQSFLRRARRWLSDHGVVVASIPNVQHHTVIRSLMEGNWTYEAAGLLDEDHVQFFTRNEVVRLFRESGYAIQQIETVPGPGYADWDQHGRPTSFTLGSLRIEGVPADRAQDYFVYQFLVVAKPVYSLSDQKNDRIIMVTRAGNDELLGLSEEFSQSWDCRRISHDITDPVQYLNSLFDLDAEWVVNIDEDAFLWNAERLEALIKHMQAEGYVCAGMPDGGVVTIRRHNPLACNIFFNVFHLAALRELRQGDPNVFGTEFDDSMRSLIPGFANRTAAALDNFEPYYSFFFWLHRNRAKVLFLDARECSVDPISTELLDHVGRPFLTHCWYARAFDQNRSRFMRVASGCRADRENAIRENHTDSCETESPPWFTDVPESEVRLGVVVAIRNRSPIQLERTMQSFSVQRHQPKEKLLFDFGSMSTLHEDYRQLASKYGWRIERFDPQPDRWNLSEAYNRAVAALDPGINVILKTDVDVLVGGNICELAAAHGRMSYCQFPYFTMPRNAVYPTTIACQEDLLKIYRQHPKARTSVGQGLFACPREWFERIGGFDLSYRHWGYEDHDLRQRAEWSIPTIEINGEQALLLHQWHPASPETQHADANRNHFEDSCRHRRVVRNGGTLIPKSMPDVIAQSSPAKPMPPHPNEIGPLRLLVIGASVEQAAISHFSPQYQRLADSPAVNFFGPGYHGFREGMPLHEAIELACGGCWPDAVIYVLSGKAPLSWEMEDLPVTTILDAADSKCPVSNWVKRARFDLVLLHDEDSIAELEMVCPGTRGCWMPKCVDTSVFKKYGAEKDCDVLVVEGGLEPFDPFQERLARLARQCDEVRFRSAYYPLNREDSFNRDWDTFKEEELAEQMGRSWLTITNESSPGPGGAGYLAIPASGSLAAGVIPSGYHPFFEGCYLELRPELSDKQIVDRLRACLANRDRMAKAIDTAYRVVRSSFSTGAWAQRLARFIEACRRGPKSQQRRAANYKTRECHDCSQSQADALRVIPDDGLTAAEDMRSGRIESIRTVSLANFVTCSSDTSEGDQRVSPEGFYSRIILDGALDVCCDALAVLRRSRQLLKPAGRLELTVSNLARESVIRSLLAGHWSEAACSRPSSRLRLFTIREIEKLLFRANFEIEVLEVTGSQRQCEEQNDARALDDQIHAVAAPISPTDYGTTSVIIVTHNELPYTIGCLDSIRMTTDEALEIIVVDNGSTNGTPEYLGSIRDIRLLRNAENRGYPAAVNQALRLARGRQVLLLNNDTIVTTGWLRRMLEALHSDPQIGLVGPVSNEVSGEQRVSTTYDDLVLLDGFAWEWAKAHRNEYVDTDRLVGFCLLIRRSTLDAIGELDERFGIGNFEDDDYCLRALQAGLRAVIARDSFVHHFGQRTFIGSGADYRAILSQNYKLFQEKWTGREVAAQSPSDNAMVTSVSDYVAVRGPGGSLVLAKREPDLTVAMIVRDNESTIGAAVDSVRPYADQVVVVDTGSVDKTPEICRKLGAEVFEFPWCDDFSAARNESLRHASGKWVFWMDSDDTISSSCGQQLWDLVRGQHKSDVMAYIMQVHCPGPNGELTVVDHVKLFRNDERIRFEGRIHEQVLPSIRKLGGNVDWTNIFVVHSGSDQTEEGRARKLERDFRLLQLDFLERPNHPFVLFNLGMTYSDAGKHKEAIACLERCLRESSADESQVRKAYALLVHSLASIGETERAFEMCQKGLQLYPSDPELLFRQGMLYHECHRFGEAEASYKKLLEMPRDRAFSSLDVGILSYKAMHNLAIVHQDNGQLDAAVELWRRITRDHPTYRPGYHGLLRSLLRTGRHDEARSILQRMRGLCADHALTEVDVLWAEADVAQSDGRIEEARVLWQRVSDSCSVDEEVLQEGGRFFFEHGPPDQAQIVLRRLVELHPDDAAGWHNLGSVHLMLGHEQEAVGCLEHSLSLRPDSEPTKTQLSEVYRRIGRDPKSIHPRHEKGHGPTLCS